jgi:hypothetical protein
MDCAARETSPRRPAANATISNAALFHRNLQWDPRKREDNLPFGTNHKDSGESKLKKFIAALEIEDGSKLYSTPGPIFPMCGRQVRIYPKQKKAKPIGYRHSQRRSKKSQGGIMDKNDIKANVNRRHYHQNCS